MLKTCLHQQKMVSVSSNSEDLWWPQIIVICQLTWEYDSDKSKINFLHKEPTHVIFSYGSLDGFPFPDGIQKHAGAGSVEIVFQV